MIKEFTGWESFTQSTKTIFTLQGRALIDCGVQSIIMGSTEYWFGICLQQDSLPEGSCDWAGGDTCQRDCIFGLAEILSSPIAELERLILLRQWGNFHPRYENWKFYECICLFSQNHWQFLELLLPTQLAYANPVYKRFQRSFYIAKVNMGQWGRMQQKFFEGGIW